MYTVNLKDRYGNRLISTADIKQTYDASSEKAMSGTAVAEAIDAAKLTDYIQSINDSEGIVDVKILDERGDNTTDLDIWSNKVESTLENGVLTITIKNCGVEGHWGENVLNNNLLDKTKKYEIRDKKLSRIESDGSRTFIANADITSITNGNKMFYGLDVTVYIDEPLANLTSAYAMFPSHGKFIISGEGEDTVYFPSLVDGASMFVSNKDIDNIDFEHMPLLTNADTMFSSSSLQRMLWFFSKCGVSRWRLFIRKLCRRK